MASLESPLNILSYAPQMAAYGGMERHVCSLMAAMAARGHHVELITTSNSLGTVLREELNAGGVVLHELAVRRGHAGPVRKLFWLLRELWRLRAIRWNIIYTNGQSALARHVWRAASKGTRIIHHHHTAADPSEQCTWSPGFRRVLTHAGELVGCSRATSSALSAATGRVDVQFLPYLTVCPVAGNTVQNRNHDSSAPLRFGFVGRLIPEKGIDKLMKISESNDLSDIEWHIHGAGEHYPAERFRGHDRMYYHGQYSGDSAQASVLQVLDAMILLSTHNEGMPLSLIEGMSAGLPWIATDRGGTREIAVEPSEALLVPIGMDDQALIAAVRGFADSIRSGRTSRRRQREAYDRTFAPQLVVGQWAEFLEAVASAPKK
jgi:glycosyltransferase involved in cell wall biosynthesis